jgi:hypothetical protein
MLVNQAWRCWCGDVALATCRAARTVVNRGCRRFAFQVSTLSSVAFTHSPSRAASLSFWVLGALHRYMSLKRLFASTHSAAPMAGYPPLILDGSLI